LLLCGLVVFKDTVTASFAMNVHVPPQLPNPRFQLGDLGDPRIAISEGVA